MAIEEADYITAPTDAQSFLGVATEMLRGAKPLIKVNPIPSFALTLLCGHTCECALKAILAFNGVSGKLLKNSPFRHDLLYMWEEVEKLTPFLASPQPDWVSQLDRVFNAPYTVRYPMGFHFAVLPDQDAMLEGSENLVILASEIIK